MVKTRHDRIHDPMSDLCGTPHECRVPLRGGLTSRWLPCVVLRCFDPRQVEHSVLVELPGWTETSSGRLELREAGQPAYWCYVDPVMIRFAEEDR